MAVTRPFSPAAPFRVHPKPVPKAAPPAPGWTRPACRPWHGPPTFRRRLSARSDRPVPADRNTRTARRSASSSRAGTTRGRRSEDRTKHIRMSILRRNRRPNPRERPASNRSGRSSDSLPSRRLPDPSRVSGRRYSELTEHHSSGTVRDLHPIPFSFRPPQEERNTRSGDKDSGFPRKRQKAGK